MAFKSVLSVDELEKAVDEAVTESVLLTVMVNILLLPEGLGVTKVKELALDVAFEGEPSVDKPTETEDDSPIVMVT